MTETRIQKADPAARRRAVGVLLVALVFAILAIGAFEYQVGDADSWAEQDADALLERAWLALLFLLVMTLPVIAAGFYLLVFASRVARAQRFPPPGYAVSRDTVILEGARAVRRARLVQVIAVVLICAVAILPVFLWYILRYLAAAT